MATAPNPYAIDIAQPNLNPILEGVGALVKSSRDAAKKERTKTEFKEILDSGDMDKLYEFSVNNPDLAKTATEAIGFKNEGTRTNLVQTMMNLDSDPNNFANYLNQRNDYLDTQGADNVDTQELLTQFAEDPEQALADARKVMPMIMNKQEWGAYKDMQGGGGDMPSTVKEWEFYNKLPASDQTRFLNMKRQGYTVKDIGGIPTVVPLIPGEEAVPLSTLENEKFGLAQIAGAKETEVGRVKGQQQRLNTLRESTAGRRQSIKNAQKFHDLFKNRNMKSGAGRSAAKYIPGVYTDQGKLDEEFNAFAEIAARQALKASGEIRPTDADVTGMKRAMFGIGRDESVNMILLENYLEQQEMDEEEFKSLKSGKAPVKRQPQESKPVQEGATATNPQTGEKVIYQNGQWQPAP